MARYIDANCKLCRRERQKLFLKGSKCFTEKCPVERRNFPPGQHAQNRRGKFSEYSVQLREKQRVRRTYGVLEAQFRNYFDRARQQTGKTGETLMKVLERRLDNVVFRLGFAPSRKAGRQLIRHRHFLVNNKIVDIPSYLLNPGDTIQVREASKKLEVIHSSLKRMKDTQGPGWLSVDKANLTGTFLRVPEREEMMIPFNEQLIVELYSK
ncbi:MAG: 30S ribosomal protein S4 [Ignavibacteriales bacterium CG07_land_8_20_14_0_80_59_12]|nr:MAG: 30S ribosomal protein S4 [Ignavibacteriales bacterium CG07_land_8_20_14_0_80_59_12]